ncbi:MAG TPA: hypothetical protein VGZ22_24320, partial [Isosphaeraceae bacterium]|nr:hypothetical protein [Isosphaeraceae bacterium]
IGNITGILVNDNGTTTSIQAPVEILNDTIAYNTTGVFLIDLSAIPGLADIANNIFTQNNDPTAGNNGAAIVAMQPDKTLVRFNMFGPGNGPASGNPGNETANIGAGFDPTALSSTKVDGLGNFIGNPVFTSPRDPRPNADGPAVFFSDASFDLQGSSSAIDNALNSLAPPLDFLSRGRVKVAGRGFPGHGPADVGAFEFQNGGSTFLAVTSGLSTSGAITGSAVRAQSSSNSNSTSGPEGIIVSFSQPVDRSSVIPTDLVLSGNGLDSVNPARATGLTWIDNSTVDFLLTGAFKSTGTVQLNIPAGTILSSSETPLAAYTSLLTLSNNQAAGSLTSSPTPAGVLAPVTTASTLSTPVAATSDSTSTTSSTLDLTKVSVVAPPATAATSAGAPAITTSSSSSSSSDGTKTSGLKSLLSTLKNLLKA